eukprot:5085540-Pyramimonas_sp.AAC.1
MIVASDDTDPLVVHLSSSSGSSGNCPSSALVFKRVSVLKILGTVIDRNFTDHEDIRHRMRCAVGAFWKDKSYYQSRLSSILSKIRRFDSRVRSKFLYGLEGASIDANAL